MRIRSISPLRSMGWPALVATCAAFALACAVLAYWAMQLLAPRAPIAPANVSVEQGVLPDLRLAGQLFGITAREAAAQAPASNIKVLGIVAAGREGSALLSVDGKRAKAYGIGDEVTPSRKVVEVRTDAVVLDFNGVRSELPSPTRASLTVLTSGVGKPLPDDAPPSVPGGPPAASVPAAPGGAPAPMRLPNAPNLPIGPGANLPAPASLPPVQAAETPPPGQGAVVGGFGAAAGVRNAYGPRRLHGAPRQDDE